MLYYDVTICYIYVEGCMQIRPFTFAAVIILKSKLGIKLSEQSKQILKNALLRYISLETTRFLVELQNIIILFQFIC